MVDTSPSRFVDSLVVPRGLRGAVFATTDDAPAASVVAGSTVSFVAGVPKQTKEDCINSTLLAFLAASHAFDRNSDTQNWYSFYVNVLANIGWDPQEFSFTQFTTSGDTFQVDQAILELVQAIGTGDELQVVTATTTALKRLARGDRSLVIWESNTHTDRQGNFQVGAAAVSDGVPVLTSSAYFFQATQKVDQLLFFTFSNSTDLLFQGGQTMSLDLDVYAQVRQAIKQKLGKNAVDFVGGLEI